MYKVLEEIKAQKPLPNPLNDFRKMVNKHD